MKDLTEGPITRHILAMAAPMAVGMLVQTLYFMVDLYFVAQQGGSALAGVGAAGNFAMAVLALTQVLSVGTVTVVSHAVGAKDHAGANLAFNQSIVLAALFALITLVACYGLAGRYMATLGADSATAAAGTTYLHWYGPGLALQFATAVMGSALRGTGIAKPTMVVQLVTVLVNIVLAPVLIAGLGTGRAFGVAGAGLASSLSVLIGTLLLALYFARLEHYVGFRGDQWQPQLVIWKKVLNIGLPAGGEFGLMFIYMAVIYWIIKAFGPAAQAGFGIGSRVMQAVLLPALAISFALAPVAGQNFGARSASRVRRTFVDGALLSCGLMLLLTLFCQWRPESLVGFFTADPATLAFGTGFLRVISWNFVGNGIIFCCSGLFQGLGNTWPSIISSATRLATFAIPAVLLSRADGFRIETLWYLSVGTVALQAVASYALLRRELDKRLRFDSQRSP